ncbi:MAG: universal stress protein [Desulfobacterales bacterium]|jgi:nucleotide-binding universal stress UspA family protein
MKNQSQQKVLLTFDGSEHAFHAINYVSKLTPFHKMKIELFNVFSNIPEAYLDLDKDPQFSRAAREVRAWEMQQKKEIQNAMENAKQKLLHSGFASDAVSIRIHNKKEGIARDIVKEAENGYNAVIIGRRGTGTYKEVIVGSVAKKIVEKVTFLPVLMIGEIPPDNKFLVAVDNSENAIRAVDYIARILGGFDFKINLFHAIRGDHSIHSGIAHLFFPKESFEEAEDGAKAVFDIAKRRLEDAGFASGQITAKLVSGVPSRAEAIIKEAREGDYGTIVLGRRGLSKVQEFLLGRVSNKVINVIRRRAVWIVT